MTSPKFLLKLPIVLAGVLTFVSSLFVQSKAEAFSFVSEIPNSTTGKSVSSILATDGRFKNVGTASLNPSLILSVDKTVAFSISSNKTLLPISEPGVLIFFDQLNKFVGNELRITSFTDRVFFGLIDPDQVGRYNIFLNDTLLFKDKQFLVGTESGIVVMQIDPGETVRVISTFSANGYLGDDGLGAVALARTQPVPEPTSTLSFLVLGVLGAGSTLKLKRVVRQSAIGLIE